MGADTGGIPGRTRGRAGQKPRGGIVVIGASFADAKARADDVDERSGRGLHHNSTQSEDRSCAATVFPSGYGA